MVKEVKINLISKDVGRRRYNILFRKDRRCGFDRIRIDFMFVEHDKEWCLIEVYIFSSIPRYVLLKIENLMRGLNSNGAI